MTRLAHLPDRAVLAVTGTDRVSFLNGLVSNDVALAAPGRAVLGGAADAARQVAGPISSSSAMARPCCWIVRRTRPP